jgi:hypothetical protein
MELTRIVCIVVVPLVSFVQQGLKDFDRAPALVSYWLGGFANCKPTQKLYSANSYWYWTKKDKNKNFSETCKCCKSFKKDIVSAMVL